MRKKVTDRRSKESRFREIESHLISAGWGGLRVAGVAKAIGKSKSYTHKLLLEMVDAGYVERQIEYAEGQRFNVNYVYYQLPLFGVDASFGLESDDAIDTYHEGDFYPANGLEGNDG